MENSKGLTPAQWSIIKNHFGPRIDPKPSEVVVAVVGLVAVNVVAYQAGKLLGKLILKLIK